MVKEAITGRSCVATRQVCPSLHRNDTSHGSHRVGKHTRTVILGTAPLVKRFPESPPKGLAGARIVSSSVYRVTLPLHFLPERKIDMPYLAGLLTGVVLTVLVVFLVDNFAVVNAPAGTEPQQIVNWDLAAQKLRSSVTTMKEEVREVRQDVREATR